MSKMNRLTSKLITIALWIICALHIYPIILVLISSVKPKEELTLTPQALPTKLTFEHFIKAFDSMNYLSTFTNSAILAFGSVFVLVILASMAAYTIGRRNNKFYNFIYLFFIAGLIIPFQMRMVPLYKLMINTHLINTHHGMGLVYVAMLAPFSVFILTGFVKTVPRSLEEAAYIDGCGTFKTFWLIIFPLLKPAISTVAVLNFFNVWNDFVMALLFIQDRSKMTITLQLANFRGEYLNDWSLILAGICMIVFPMLVVYLFAQRYIIDGITAGAVKG